MPIAFILCLLPSQINEQKLLAIAHRAIAAEVAGAPAETYTGGEPARPVFVTLEQDGRVLGCRGDLVARSTSLEQEVATEARSACAHDPRYRPISAAAARSAQVTVTIVEGQEPISNVDSLEPKDGLVLRSGDRVGVVLPWEGKDPRTRLKWAYRKAGVSEGAPVELLLLKAERFRG